MNIIDFIIGLTLVNTIPHFVFGVWRQRMLSGLGISPTRNLLYGLLNFSISIGLFVSTYGLGGFADHGMYVGGLFVVVAYFATGKLLRDRFASPAPAASLPNA